MSDPTVTLTPAERDPFAEQSVTLTPVPHDPFDPLAASAGIAPAGPTPVGSAMLKGAVDWYKAQPSWLERAAAVHAQSDPTTLRPTQAEIDFGIDTAGSFGASTMRDPLFHGSPERTLGVLNESTRGPLGPGVYTSPAEQIAGHYAGEAGKVYQLPQTERDIFRGAGHRTDEEWFGFKADKQRLLEAAEPDKREAVSAMLDKAWSNDGYPLYQNLRHLYQGHEGAQELFKRAGFEGVSGLVDGPETLLFGQQPLGIRAYHGSPHDFDRFDLSKIGTGEGAQAYGHGLYMAGNEEVAKSYKSAGPEASRQLDIINGKLTRLAREMDQYRGPQYGTYTDPKGYELKAEYDRLMDDRTKVGRMYEVNIAADPSHFLDWDKPLSEQPHVQKRLEATGHMAAFSAGRGSDVYSIAGSPGSGVPNQAEATKLLRDAGIPGIKYLDQGSRNPVPSDVVNRKYSDQWNKLLADRNAATGTPRYDELEGQRKALWDKMLEESGPQRTSNYVVFDDKLIDIIKKYSLAGLIAGGAAHFKTRATDDPAADTHKGREAFALHHLSQGLRDHIARNRPQL